MHSWKQNGLPQPFICTGQVSCFYDIKAEPESKDDAHAVWPYAWGSEQTGIAPGHLQVAWLWVSESA